jgi:hypothetical protein
MSTSSSAQVAAALQLDGLGLSAGGGAFGVLAFFPGALPVEGALHRRQTVTINVASLAAAGPMFPQCHCTSTVWQSKPKDQKIDQV